MRAFVTGGSGFVGRRLVERLLAGGAEVHLLLRRESRIDPGVVEHTGARIHRAGGRTEDISAAVREAAPDVAFHLASLFVAEHHAADVEPLVLSNLLFGAQVVDALVAAGTRRLVAAGTAWRHSGPEGRVPVNLYAATKEAFCALLEYWVSSAGLRAVTLDLCDTYGPGDRRPKLVPLLLRMAGSGEAVPFSPGEQAIDLVHVDDVVEAFVVAGLRTGSMPPASHETFTVSSGDPRPLREVVETFEKAVGRPVAAAWGARPYRDREVMAPWSGGAALPGWTPRIPLSEGFHGLAAALRDR